MELINAKLQPLHEHDSHIISSLNRVCFGADPNHDETTIIRLKYDRLNQKSIKFTQKKIGSNKPLFN